MPLSIAHSFVSPVADDPAAIAANEVTPSRWNASHSVTGQLAASELSNGTTGSGSIVLSTSPVLITPNIGAATGTTLGLTAGSISDGSHPFFVTATLPATLTANQEVARVDITPAGSSSFDIRALRVVCEAGYSGPNSTYGTSSSSLSAGTGNTLIPAAESFAFVGNVGMGGGSSGTGTLNIGTTGHGANGTTNVGLLGLSQTSKNSGTNIAVAGSAYNAGTGTAPQIGGWFSLNQTTVPTVSAALIADNGAQSAPIFLARANGTTKLTVASNGNIGAGTETNPQFPFVVSQNTATGLSSSLTGTINGLMCFGQDSLAAGYSVLTAAANGVCSFLRVDGTAASPSNLANGEIIGAFLFGGWGNAAQQSGRVRILATTSEAWSGATFGSYLQFDTTPAAGARAQSLRLMAGAIVGAGTTDPGAGNLIASGKLTPGSFTVGTLPAGSNAGDSVYSSNCRVFNGAGTQEGAGAGTGGLVNYNGSAWKIAGTNVTAVA